MIHPNTPIAGLRPGTLAALRLALALSSPDVFALGEARQIETHSTPGSFALCDGAVATIVMDTNDWPGVARAAGDLATDLNRVTGQRPGILHQPGSAGTNIVNTGGEKPSYLGPPESFHRPAHTIKRSAL